MTADRPAPPVEPAHETFEQARDFLFNESSYPPFVEEDDEPSVEPSTTADDYDLSSGLGPRGEAFLRSWVHLVDQGKEAERLSEVALHVNHALNERTELQKAFISQGKQIATLLTTLRDLRKQHRSELKDAFYAGADIGQQDADFEEYAGQMFMDACERAAREADQ